MNSDSDLLCINTKCLPNCLCYSFFGSEAFFFFYKSGPEVIKLFSCLINMKYQEIQQFLGSDKPRMLFFQLINVKMPTIVGILTFMCRKNFMLS